MFTNQIGDYNMKSWVCKERYGGKWINTYFWKECQAKKLALKIIKKGGIALWVKVAY